MAYGELVGESGSNCRARQECEAEPHPREWTVLGTAVPRIDMRAMVTGQFEFVHNVRVPGMLHGRVVRPPAVGATLISVDEAFGERICLALVRSSSRTTSSASSPKSRGRRCRPPSAFA